MKKIIFLFSIICTSMNIEAVINPNKPSIVTSRPTQSNNSPQVHFTRIKNVIGTGKWAGFRGTLNAHATMMEMTNKVDNVSVNVSVKNITENPMLASKNSTEFGYYTNKKGQKVNLYGEVQVLQM